MPELIRRPFVFLRHGQSVRNLEGRIAGSCDVPLTPQGEAEAQAARMLLEAVEWSLVVSSPLERARRTAELAVGRAPDRLIEGLRERHWGVLEGQPAPRPMPHLIEPEGGEAWHVFVERIVVTLNAVLEQTEAPPLIVGHSGLPRVMRFLVHGTPEGPRTANAIPMWVAPAADGWEMRPFTADDVAALRQLPATLHATKEC
ncbi:histidine phosphatase family protein [Halomonas shantousis]